MNKLDKHVHASITAHRNEIKQILEGRDDRLLIIVGPCSAWPSPAVIQYAEKLSRFNESVNDKLKIIMRVYTQKPRTMLGWLGPAYHPDPFSTPNIAEGIEYSLSMMKEITQIGLPIASELLFMHYPPEYCDYLSWGAIGARSTENQEHRILASSLDIPIGMKNPTHGSLLTGIHSVIAAQHRHHAILYQQHVHTPGNPHAHLVLRGGNGQPNYSFMHLEYAKECMAKFNITNPSLLIDASHENCTTNGVTDHQQQPQVIFETLQLIKRRPELRKLVKGFMIESFLKEGKQNIALLNANTVDLDGLSITDPCLGWDQTVTLLNDIYRTQRGQVLS